MSGSKRISRAALRELVADGKVHVEWALVVERMSPATNTKTHWEKTPNAARPGHHRDILIYADMMPSEEPLEVSLTTVGSAWDIPRPGALICVAIPGGDLEGFEPALVGEAVGGAGPPAGLDGNTTLLGIGKPKVKIGSGSGTQPAVLGTNLETRLAALERAFAEHEHGTDVGPTTGPLGLSVANPPFGQPGHVGGNPGDPTIAGTSDFVQVPNPAWNGADPYALDPATGKPYPQYLRQPPAPAPGSGILSTVVEVA